MSVFLLILGALLFVGLVVVHEWGHFIAARRGGVEVEEFGIGFPPKIWGKKIKTERGKFLFTVNALPLGGFVRLKGENDADKRPGSFGAAPMLTKFKIMTAGVTMNLLVAVALFTVVALIGMPKLFDHQFTVASDTKIIEDIKNKGVVAIDRVSSGSPAEKAGLQAKDQIMSIDGQAVTKTHQVSETAKNNAGKTVPVTVKRGDQVFAYNVTLNSEDKGQGYLGVVSTSNEEGRQIQRSTWSAPIVAVGVSAQITELTFKGIGTAVSSLFKGDTEKASEQVAGPVGVAYILKQVSEIGINFMLVIIAIISLSLAIMNILPIPALDGGRLFVTFLFHAIKKPLTKEREELIHGTGFVALMVLFVLITIVDVKRFF